MSLPADLSTRTHADDIPAGAIACLALLLSGAAALGWQVVWTSQWSVGLGHEHLSVLAVLGAFFAGMSLGAAWLGGRIDRSPRPLRWYVALECLMAAWGLVLVFVLPAVQTWAGRLIGAEPSVAWHFTIALGVPFVCLLPSTLAMGAALPAMHRIVQGATPSVGGLYAANTAGAVLGVLGTAFWSIPMLGFQRTGLLGCALHLICALLAGWSLRNRQSGNAGIAGIAGSTRSAVTAAADQAATGQREQAPYRLLAVTGLLGVAYEVIAFRVLSQVTENTVYSYALLLAVYLTGTAVGSALFDRRMKGASCTRRTLEQWLLVCVWAVLAGAVAAWWVGALASEPTAWFGRSAWSALAGETLAALAVMGLPTMAMGALFACAAQLTVASGGSLGRALAFNTAGGALAPLAGALWLAALGMKGAILLLCLGYLALAAAGNWRRPAVAVTAGLMLLASLSPTLRLTSLPPGGEVLHHRDGMMASVSVIADGDQVRRLHINNRIQEGSSAHSPLEIRLAQIPMLLHPDPRQVLVLGLGTGYTALVAAQEPRVRAVAVELLPEVIEASSWFEGSAPRDRDRLRIVQADARRYVTLAPVLNDVIVADLFHPARSGAGPLFTVEHFQAIADTLAPGGIFCQWLPVHQMELDNVRSVAAAFLAVYPDAVAVLAGNSLDSPVLGLIARKGGTRWDAQQIRRRMNALSGSGRALAQQARLVDEWAVLGSALASNRSLTRWVGDAPINTDDHPVISYRAPWDTYAPPSTPRQRMSQLLDAFEPDAPGWLPRDDAVTVSRLQSYWSIRNRYLQAGLQIAPSPDPMVMLDRLEPLMLDLLRASPDFQPARDPLLGLANAVKPIDAARSQSVLNALQSIQPASRIGADQAPAAKASDQ
jgi:spermidine synthase